MAKLTGKILYIYPTQQLVSKSGNSFTKRDFVLAMQSFDRDTGEPTIDEENTPMFTLTGDRCSQLDNIQKGQIVTVDFYVRGRRYRDENNKERIITDINVTSVRAHGAVISSTSATPSAPIAEPLPPANVQPTDAGGQASGPVGQKAVDDLPF